MEGTVGTFLECHLVCFFVFCGFVRAGIFSHVHLCAPNPTPPTPQPPRTPLRPKKQDQEKGSRKPSEIPDSVPGVLASIEGSSLADLEGALITVCISALVIQRLAHSSSLDSTCYPMSRTQGMYLKD